MSDGGILYERNNHVAYVTLNRPEKLNALDDATMDALYVAMKEAEYDDEVRVIVLRANGRSFCTGYDVGEESKDGFGHNIHKDIPRLRVWGDKWTYLWRLTKPIISQIHGHCLAAGMDMAIHCDLVIAAEDAIFGYPAVRDMGAPPNHMYTYLVGPQWAKYILLTGNPVDGKTAERIGLAWKAVPPDELAQEVDTLAHRMAETTWEALAANKNICNRAVDLMGRALLQQLAADNDAIAHQAPAVREFERLTREKGVKAALASRGDLLADYRRRSPHPHAR